MTAQVTQSFAEQLEEAVKAVWNEGDLDAADTLFAEDAILHSIPEQQDIEGLDEVKQTMTQFTTAFPDFEMEITSMIVGDERVVFQWVGSGTHEGELEGLDIAPTHEKITWEGVNIFKVEDEQVTEAWEYYDMMSVMQQLGVLPESFTLASFLETGANLAKQEILKLGKGS